MVIQLDPLLPWVSETPCSITSRSYESQTALFHQAKYLKAAKVRTLGYREWRSIVHAHQGKKTQNVL